jgi:antitoxin component HigA of HigAB toxin-antitoxin module
MNTVKKTRKSNKEAMRALSVRMPAWIIDHFQQNYPNGSKQIRIVLEQYALSQGAINVQNRGKTNGSHT